jgi:hypothetical protein
MAHPMKCMLPSTSLVQMLLLRVSPAFLGRPGRARP